MTPSLEAFEHFKSGSIGSSKTSQQGLKVEGFGEVIVSTEERNYVVPGVYYVPNVGFNTLSLSQLIIQGFKVIFKGTKCVLMRQFEEEMSDNESSEDMDGKCSNKVLQELDLVKEKAIKELVKYYDSFYFDLSIDESLDGKEHERLPSKNDFDSLISFMKMINEQEIKEGCKDLVKNHFEKLVKWFYQDYLICEERTFPVKIDGVEICLLDLYLVVKKLGGYAYVAVRNKWKQVANALELPKNFADGIREVYATHLGLLGAYYETARSYSLDDLAPEAEECIGAREELALDLPKGEDLPGCVEDMKEKHEEEPMDVSCCKKKDDDDDFIIVDS